MAIFSKGAIEIGEISPLINFFFLVELFHSLYQKRLILNKDKSPRNADIKALFFSIFTLTGVILGYFYFIHDYKLTLLQLLLNLLVYGLYSSLIALNSNLIFIQIFGKPKIIM